MSSKFKERVNQEAGVVLPLLGIIIFVLIFIAVGYSVDVVRTKNARSWADLRAQEWCAEAVKSLPFTAMAVDDIARAVNDDASIPSYAELIAVRIFSPSPDDDGEFPLDLPYATTLIPPPTTPACATCEFFGDVTAAAARDRFPSGFFDDPDLMNGWIGCEVEVQADTIFSGQTTARGKAVHAARVRGNRPATGDFKQVILGIDPNVEIYGTTDARFQFSGAPAPVFAGTPQDPLAAADDSFRFNRPPFVVGAPLSATLVGNQGMAALSPERNEMLLGCYNPFIAFRNIFLESLVERLARFWFTKANTHILLSAPRNANASAAVAGGNRNPPYLLTGMVGPYGPSTATLNDFSSGEDLMQPIFLLPYINYVPPTVAAQPDGFPLAGRASGNYLCPFAGFVGPPATGGGCFPQPPPINLAAQAIRQRHSLTVRQLRDCYHANSAVDGYVTWADTVLSDYGGVTNFSGHADHEPPEYASSNSVFNNYSADYVNGDHWDQWAAGGGLNPRGLTAPEIMRILGRVEGCPNGAGIGAAPPNAPCTKPPVQNDPTVVPNGIIGDVVAFLRYVNHNATGNAQPTSGRAYRFPGLLTPSSSYNPNSALVNNNEDVSNGMRTNVAYVFSKRIDPGETASIQAEVAALSPDQDLTLIYIPTQLADNSQVAINTILNAFQATIPGVPGSRHVLFVLAPPQSGSGSCTAANEQTCFRDWWENALLDDDSGFWNPLSGAPPSASEIAKNIAATRLFITELVL